MDVGREDEPGQRDRIEMDVVGARWRGVHGGTRLGQEVLDDHLLHVAVALMQCRDGLERFDASGARLADADEDAGGEGDGEPTCGVERGQATGRGLVGRAAMTVERGVERLEHHALRRAHGPQCRQLVVRERAGVGVRQEPGLLDDQPAHRREVVERRCEPVLGQPRRGHGVARLRALAQGEQGFVTAGRGARARDRENLLGREVWRLDARRGLGERAVAAAVAAELGQRDEDLGGVCDPRAVGAIAHGRGEREQLGQRGSDQVRGHGCHPIAGRRAMVPTSESGR